MIKIPATDEGIPAIEEALYEGININVTLLFAVAAYERVMEAYIRAMERRHAEGKPLDRHSVASFFVSRVDTEVDKRLEALGNTRPAGHAPGWPTPAPPTRRSSEIFERRALRRRCARPAARSSARCGRRPASRTRTTRETLYVYGPRRPRHRQHDAAADAAGRRASAARSPARPPPRTRPPTSTRWREAGIDLDDVTDKLLRDGIDAVHGPDGQAARRASSASARRSSPAARRDRGRPAAGARAAARRARQARARRGRRPPDLAAATGRCGRRQGTPEVDRPARLADDRRASCSRRPTRSRRSRAKCAPTG